MRFTAGFLLMLAMCSSVFGQLETSKASVVINAKGAEVGADFITIDSEDQPVVKPALKCVVKSDYKSTSILAFEKGVFKPATVISRNNIHYVVGPGTFYVLAQAYDPEKGIVNYPFQEVTIGVPTPTPVPTPDNPVGPVPDDVYDNIGKQVAATVVGLPKNKEIGTIYKEAAKLIMAVDQTPSSVGLYITNNRSQVAGADLEKYAKTIDVVNNQLTKSWPTLGTKDKLSAFFSAVAAGFGVQ